MTCCARGAEERGPAWTTAREEIRAAILENGWNEKAGLLPGAGRWPVAVEDLRLVLVPRCRRPVRVDDQGPAPAMNDDLVVERAQQDTVLDRGRAAVGLVLGVVHLARAGGLV